MITKEELEKRYEKLSNKELLDIIDNKFRYTELAIVVALEEISKRKLNENDIKTYKSNKEKEFNSLVIKYIGDDLSFFQKIFFFFIWLPFLNFPMRRVFFENNYVLKLKQANYYSWAGFIFCLLASFISSKYFDNSNITMIIIWMICFVLPYLFDKKFNRQRQIKKLLDYYSNHENEDETNEKETEDVSI